MELKTIKLHIGCGTVYHEGWINIDNNSDNNIARLDMNIDLREPLPFQDNTVDFIYNEHFMEHLTWKEGLQATKEFMRVLKPNGVLRIAMPDLDKTIQIYEDKDWKTNNAESFEKYGLTYIETAAQHINICFRDWGHKHLYDYEELVRLLRNAGFADMCRRLLHESTYEELRGLETREESTLIVEAAKEAKPVPLLTVICTAYNQEEFIRDALDSFVAQKTDFNFEVFISDDASTDKTTEIIKEYERNHKDLFKVLYRSKNLGAMENGILTLNEPRSKYVVINEGDDYFTDPYKLQKQVDFLESHPQCSMCFHPATVHYQDGSLPNSIYPSPQQRYGKTILELEDLLKTNFMQTNSVMYRWRFVEENFLDVFPKSILPGDHYIHLLHAQKGSIGFIDEVMSVYRRHPGGLWWDSQNPNALHFRYFVEIFSFYYEVYENIAIDKKAYYSDVLTPCFYGQLLSINNSSRKTEKLSRLVEKYPLFAAEQLFRLYQKEREVSHFYLFPFDRVSKNSKIVIYGAGAVCQSYLDQIIRLNYCDCLLIIDRDYERIRQIAGIEVQAPAQILNCDYDNVVIASKLYSDELFLTLVGLKVPENKIIKFDGRASRQHLYGV